MPHDHNQLSRFPAADVRDWVFDLDNTIYPASSNLFVRVSNRITAFVADHFDVPEEKANDIQLDLFRRYGTTMRGLMEEHGLEPDGFLAYVHDIDLSDIAVETELDGLLGALPGRRHIFTNGTVPHAENVLNAYGIRHHFDHIFDIVASEFVPKSERVAYERFFEATRIEPGGSVMVEDMAKNLKPAHELGMHTVWLESKIEWAAKGSSEPYVHYTAPDLKKFLSAIATAP